MAVFSCCSRSNVEGIWMWKYLSLLLPGHVAPCHVTRNCFQTRFFHNRFWKCAFCCCPVCCCCFFQSVRTQCHPNVCAKAFSKSTGFSIGGIFSLAVSELMENELCVGNWARRRHSQNTPAFLRWQTDFTRDRWEDDRWKRFISASVPKF